MLTKEELRSAILAITRAMAIIYELPESLENSRLYEKLQDAKSNLKRSKGNGRRLVSSSPFPHFHRLICTYPREKCANNLWSKDGALFAIR